MNIFAKCTYQKYFMLFFSLSLMIYFYIFQSWISWPASNDESISCIHKSWLGNKCQFSVSPPPVQLSSLSYRIATEEPGENQRSILNQKDNFLKSKIWKLISESPQNILLWKRKRIVFYIFFKLLKIVRQ